jgi:D-alanine-D-alanine ligase
MVNKIKVAVLFGGQSSEHEVSRISAQSVLENIDRDRFAIKAIGITKSGEWLTYDGDISLLGTGQWEEVARKKCQGDAYTKLREKNSVDVVFPVLHGPNGEDGSIQGLLQLVDIPYVGCNILSSAVGMDKEFAKLVFNNAGIPQADYIKVMRSELEELKGEMDELLERVSDKLGWPCFVKPANAGSSVGVSKVKDPKELFKALKFAAKYDSKILIEEFIKGRELECAVLGNDSPTASTVGEIIPSNDFYDYNAKYIDGKSGTVIPADIDERAMEQIRDYSVRAFKALGCSGLSRVDFFLEESGRVILNEINTMPGFTSISMYAKLWEASGIPYKELITRLIDLAFESYQQRTRSYERK